MGIRWLGVLNFVITFPLGFVKDARVGSTQLVNLIVTIARRKVIVFEVIIGYVMNTNAKSLGAVFVYRSSPCSLVLRILACGIVGIFAGVDVLLIALSNASTWCLEF
jgi:hypothetical protein